MIKVITSNNLSDLQENNFLSKKQVKEDLEQNPFGKYIINIKNDQIVGYLYYSDIYERAEINQIEVQKENRNCKIGTEMMDFFTKTVEKEISLEVKKNNIAALKLYKKFGFEEKAIRRNYYHGIDGILMIKNKK